MDRGATVQIDIEEIRNGFPVTRNWIYMNHAGIAPISLSVYRAMDGMLQDVTRNGMANLPEWDDVCSRTRESAARLIGADASEIAFVKNTSDGILIAANGLPWRQGDNVVIPDRGFPANVFPWLNLRPQGVEVRRVPEVDGRIPLDDLLNAVDDRTRVLSVSSVEFASGYRHDLREIGRFCRARGVLFFVDAIQSLGVLPLDVTDAEIDFVSADAHKWLLGPEGIGVFYCSHRARPHLRVVNLGWANVVEPRDFLSYDTTLLPDARRFECGTLNTVGIHGLRAGLDLLLRIGIESIEARVLSLTDQLCAGLEEKGCRVVSSRARGEKSGIVVFRHSRTDTQSIFQKLSDARVVCAIRGGGIRLSPHFYNTEEEVDRVLDAIP
ncbi:MAG: aminotransferase class V-fold PLP-dependent enzyme [Gemmatimonadota bacterium]|nr:aminotransferase class V-fold PLP-dependent enzyme [Gemmatimonadota bacterium]